MSTLDDLRSALEHEAAFDDTERHVRGAAVRQRVRAVKRRRAGVLAVGAATVLVAVIATVGVLRGSPAPEPAGPTLDDVSVPQSVDVDGFPYVLTMTTRAGHDGAITLPDPPDGPAAVSLVATGLGSGRATLWSGYYPIARVRGTEQASVPTTGGTSELRVEFDGAPDSARAEVVVYEPTGALADGVATDGAVFRRQYADRELVAAAFARAGAEARVDLPADLWDEERADDLETSAFCHSATPGLWLHQAGRSGATRCADLDTGVDPGPTNQGYLARPRPGDDSVAVYVTQGADGPRANNVEVTFGAAVYRRTVAPRIVLGQDFPTVLEQLGRTWRLTEVLERHGDDIDVDTSESDVFVGAVATGATEMSVGWAGAPEGGWAGLRPTDTPQDQGALFVGVLLAGDRTVRFHLGGPAAEGRLVIYRPM